MKDRKRNIKSDVTIWQKNNRGVTMVETLVAFAVLMIIFAILYTVVSFCVTLRMRAHDTSQAIQTFSREMYNKDNEVGKNTSNHIAIKNYSTTGNVPLFYLSLSEDTSKENMGDAYYNKAFPATGEGTVEELDLSLLNIDAITYVYLPGTGENAEDNELKIIVPKAIQFIHKEEP